MFLLQDLTPEQQAIVEAAYYELQPKLNEYSEIMEALALRNASKEEMSGAVTEYLRLLDEQDKKVNEAISLIVKETVYNYSSIDKVKENAIELIKRLPVALYNRILTSKNYRDLFSNLIVHNIDVANIKTNGSKSLYKEFGFLLNADDVIKTIKDITISYHLERLKNEAPNEYITVVALVSQYVLKSKYVIKCENIKNESKRFLNIPSTAPAGLFADILSFSNSEYGLYASRLAEIDGSEVIPERNDKAGTFSITKETKNSISAVELHFNEIVKKNPLIKKYINIISSKGCINCYDINSKSMYRHDICITAKELVEDYHIYTQESNAIVGLENFVDFWKKAQPAFYAENKKNGKLGKQLYIPYAKYIARDGGTLYFEFNDSFDNVWIPYFEKYVPMPIEAYTLSSRPYDMFYWILQRARQSEDDIRKNGKFKIGLRLFQTHLSLQDETKTKNPKKYITDVINDCIEEINNTFKDKIILKLKPKGKESYSDYLDNTQVEISFVDEDYRKKYSTVSKCKKEKIEQNIEKKKQIGKKMS